MSHYAIKVNVSGSWANLVQCEKGRLDDVKAACESLAMGHIGAIAFKVIDAASGDVIAAYNNRPRSGEPHGWYQVIRMPIDNPIQSGLDRTTSGAIGQP